MSDSVVGIVELAAPRPVRWHRRAGGLEALQAFFSALPPDERLPGRSPRWTARRSKRREADRDGTLGLKTIGGSGGMTIAQDPATAKCDSMPRNASTLGMADRTLPPEKIPEELLACARHLTVLTDNDRGTELNQQISDSPVAICEVL